MRNKYKKYLLFILLAIGAISLITGYQVWNKPHKNIKNAPALKITATSLYNRFITDSNDKPSEPGFINKVLVISGQVKQVLENEQHQQIILMRTSVPGGAVNCTLEGKAVRVSEGDTITIKGICLGYMGGNMEMGLPGDVFLIRCYML